MECPAPFLPELPARGGDVGSRFCAPIPNMGTCCLPCPREKYFYPDRFNTAMHAMNYVSVVSVVACIFLLISFAVLPIEYTNRHHLSVCITIGILLMCLSFVIPMGNPESQCFDSITPHDMYSSMNCALSGAFLLGGSFCTVFWVFIRSLALHLQICWKLVPGKKFFLGSQLIGWALPVACLAITLSITGMAFRFGESCHVNAHKGRETFWGPLLAAASASIVVQFITFIYCVRVYIRSLMEDKQTTTHHSESDLPYSQSVRTVTAAQALRRVYRVLTLQWRAILMICIVLIDVIYFATVFLRFDRNTEKTPENIERAKVWAVCLILSGGDKTKCFEEAHVLVVSEAYAISVKFLLSCNGFWALALLGRSAIYRGWYHQAKKLFKIITRRSSKQDEFVSLNAARMSERQSPSYEMFDSKTGHNAVFHTVEPGPLTSPIRDYDPSTFSAQLRAREAENLRIMTPAYSPYTDDVYSHHRSPSNGPQFSPFKDSPYSAPSSGATSPTNDFSRRPSIARTVSIQRNPSVTVHHTRRTESQASIGQGPFSPYRDSSGEASPRFPESARLPGDGNIGWAK